MFPFTPTYLKHGRQFVKDARKLVAYKRDLVSDETLQEVEREISHLEHAVAKRDRAEVSAQMQRLDEACGKLTKPTADAAWRENVEVFLVAIVIALAVRTYFLQPFTIPTGSMQPTLNGIIGTPSTETPNVASQAIQKILYWRTWFNVVAQDDESVLLLSEVKRYRFFSYTKISTSHGNTYFVPAPPSVLSNNFDVRLDRTYKKGESIAQGFVDTGDHVFVDKFTYHFMRPQRDQVFVFSTRDIEKLNPKGTPSQYYIKRLAGVPNDDLRVASPELFINDHRAEGTGFGESDVGASRKYPWVRVSRLRE